MLSLFDGMSCGRIALDQLGIPVTNYYASEIDKWAIKVSAANYPDIIQLGDVRDVKPGDLPKIDLLIGGSPCQGFSFAGHQLNFDDPRSKLFFEYVRLLKALEPKYFMLENVRMKKESMDIITNMLGVEPIAINSNLVSAQNRYRLYWTNIPIHGQPKDRGVVLKDIVESSHINRDKFHCLKTHRYKGGKKKLVFSKEGLCRVGDADIKAKDYNRRVYHPDGKSPTLTAMQGGHQEPKIINEDAVTWRKLTPLECERLQTVPDNYTNHVSNTQRYRMLGNGWTIEVIKHIFQGMQES